MLQEMLRRMYDVAPSASIKDAATSDSSNCSLPGRWRDVDARLITVKGERHTGTNFIEGLLLHHFPRRVRRRRGVHLFAGCDVSSQQLDDKGLDRSWCCSKHGLPAVCVFAPPPVYVITLKLPFAWLVSIHAHPYAGCGVNRSFSAFLRQPFAAYGMCRPFRVRETPVDVWSEYSLAAQRMAGPGSPTPAVLWRDTDYLSERRLRCKLEELAARMGLSIGGATLPRTLAVSMSGYGRTVKWTPKAYYEQGEKLRRTPWRGRYSDADLAWVNGRLTDEAMSGFDRPGDEHRLSTRTVKL